MKALPISRGFVALVDDADYPLLSQFKWHAVRKRGKPDFYAWRRDGKKKMAMHRLLVPEVKPSQEIDHRNGNTLDNQRHNLRIATKTQNHGNARLHPTNTSGFKGVSWQKGKWVAAVGYGCKAFYLGRFVDIKDAARAYDAAAVKFFGEFARTNAMLGLL